MPPTLGMVLHPCKIASCTAPALPGYRAGLAPGGRCCADWRHGSRSRHRPHEVWQRLVPPGSVDPARPDGHAAFWPGTLPDGRQTLRPIRALPGHPGRGAALLIVNQAGVRAGRRPGRSHGPAGRDAWARGGGRRAQAGPGPGRAASRQPNCPSHSAISRPRPPPCATLCPSCPPPASGGWKPGAARIPRSARMPASTAPEGWRCAEPQPSSVSSATKS